MNTIGNILWLLLGGAIVAALYFIVGALFCVTIVGIPFGLQLFKLGRYAIWPFDSVIVNSRRQPGCLSTIMNLFWILLGWWEIAILHLICGFIFSITIVGLPFGLQHFRMIALGLSPFGKDVL